MRRPGNAVGGGGAWTGAEPDRNSALARRVEDIRSWQSQFGTGFAQDHLYRAVRRQCIQQAHGKFGGSFGAHGDGEQCGRTGSLCRGSNGAGVIAEAVLRRLRRSEEHTSELQSLMRISYAVFCLKKKKKKNTTTSENNR